MERHSNLWYNCGQVKLDVPEAIARCFVKRPADLHKYAAGIVTIIGGSAHYPHAPVIAALGARTGGAGLVRLIVPDASRAAAAALVPEATFDELAPDFTMPRTDVTAIGMGLGTDTDGEMLVTRVLSNNTGRFVIDASALTILAKWQTLPHVNGRSVILTPHVGEAARLLDCTSDEILCDRLGAVRRLVDRYNATVVLKGPHTLVAAPDRAEVFECHAGNPFMALGGMGDLLSGMLSARWAYLSKSRPDPDAAYESACAAVWLHAAASDKIVIADPSGDPSITNTARAAASMRVTLEKQEN